MAITFTLSGCGSLSNGWYNLADRALNSDRALSPEEVSANYQKKIAEKVAEAASSATPEKTVVKSSLKDVSNKLSQSIQGAIDNTLGNSKTELTITEFEKSKPRFELLNVKGFMPSSNGHIQNFIQSSIHSTSNRYTINAGLGRRYLSQSEKVITGINAFLDYDVRYGHQRFSVGGEIKSSTLELTANSYTGISKWKTGKNGNTERALSGYDLEIGVQIPFVPSAKIYLKKFNWEMYDATDIEGADYSFNFSQIFNSNMGLEVSHRDYSGASTDESFVRLNYEFPFGDQKIKKRESFFSQYMFKNRSMRPHMLNKVRRNNAIVVQTKFSSGVGGV